MKIFGIGSSGGKTGCSGVACGHKKTHKGAHCSHGGCTNNVVFCDYGNHWEPLNPERDDGTGPNTL